MRYTPNPSFDALQRATISHLLTKEHGIPALDICINGSDITIDAAESYNTWDIMKTIDSLLRAWDIDFHQILITEAIDDNQNFMLTITIKTINA